MLPGSFTTNRFHLSTKKKFYLLCYYKSNQTINWTSNEIFSYVSRFPDLAENGIQFKKKYIDRVSKLTLRVAHGEEAEVEFRNLDQPLKPVVRYVHRRQNSQRVTWTPAQDSRLE